ncbi:MAG TPA: hypothetical protein VGH80_02710 [Xanthomonadaceae bacterium]
MRGFITGILLASGLAAGVVAAAPPPPAVASTAETDRDAAAGPPDEIASMRRSADYHRGLAQALSAENQPRSFALAALLWETGFWGDAAANATSATNSDAHGDPQLLAWRKTAEAHAGSDVLADEVLAGLADEARDPQGQRAAAKRWAAAEPDNLAPLFFSDDAAETVLAAVRSRNRFDLHWLELVRWIAAAVERYPQLVDSQDLEQDGQRFPLEEVAESEAQAMAATVIPEFTPIVQACKGAALSLTPTRRADCDALGHVMADASDTWVARQIGIDILERTTTDPRALAALQAAKRRAQWQLQKEGVLAETQPRRALDSHHALLADPAIRTEMQLIERTLEDAHVPLDPPAGWQSPH